MWLDVSRGGGMYGRILTAIDGSKASADTLGQAVQLARELGAELYTISVQEWPTPLEVIGMEVEIPQALHDEFFEEAQGRIRSAAEEAGVRVGDTRVVKGNPACAILRYIEEVGFDFVILGRRGKGLMHRLRWKSTCHKVIACANCPVIVCPACADEVLERARGLSRTSELA
jgi:nucleotide-binding universal stress UspA family protein